MRFLIPSFSIFLLIQLYLLMESVIRNEAKETSVLVRYSFFCKTRHVLYTFCVINLHNSSY